MSDSFDELVDNLDVKTLTRVIQRSPPSASLWKALLKKLSEKFKKSYSSLEEVLVDLKKIELTEPTTNCENYYASTRCLSWAFQVGDTPLVEFYLDEGRINPDLIYILCAQYNNRIMMEKISPSSYHTQMEAFVSAFIGGHLELAIDIEKQIVYDDSIEEEPEVGSDTSDIYDPTTTYEYMPYAQALYGACVSGSYKCIEWLTMKQFSVDDNVIVDTLKDNYNLTRDLVALLDLSSWSIQGEYLIKGNIRRALDMKFTIRDVNWIIKNKKEYALQSMFYNKSFCIECLKGYRFKDPQITIKMGFLHLSPRKFTALLSRRFNERILCQYLITFCAYLEECESKQFFEVNPGNYYIMVEFIKEKCEESLQLLGRFAAITGNISSLSLMDKYPFTEDVDDKFVNMIFQYGDPQLFDEMLDVADPEDLFSLVLSLLLLGKEEQVSILLETFPEEMESIKDQIWHAVKKYPLDVNQLIWLGMNLINSSVVIDHVSSDGDTYTPYMIEYIRERIQ